MVGGSDDIGGLVWYKGTVCEDLTLQHTLVIRIIGIHRYTFYIYSILLLLSTFMQLNCLHIQLLYLLMSYYIMHYVLAKGIARRMMLRYISPNCFIALLHLISNTG